MTLDEYQTQVPRFNHPDNDFVLKSKMYDCVPGRISVGDALYSALGVGGEAGEVEDLVKKWIFHNRTLDLEHLRKEMGDVLWYLALLCNTFDIRMEDLLQLNIDKLDARYPDGFNFHDANHRKPGDI